MRGTRRGHVRPRRTCPCRTGARSPSACPPRGRPSGAPVDRRPLVLMSVISGRHLQRTKHLSDARQPLSKPFPASGPTIFPGLASTRDRAGKIFGEFVAHGEELEADGRPRPGLGGRPRARRERHRSRKREKPPPGQRIPWLHAQTGHGRQAPRPGTISGCSPRCALESSTRRCMVGRIPACGCKIESQLGADATRVVFKATYVVTSALLRYSPAWDADAEGRCA